MFNIKQGAVEFWQGAVENVLKRSTSIQLLDGSVVEMDQSSRNLVLQDLHETSIDALRCLGFAYKVELSEFETYDGDEDHLAHRLLLEPSNYSSIESKLTFVGLAGVKVLLGRKFTKQLRIVEQLIFVSWLLQAITRIHQKLYIMK